MTNTVNSMTMMANVVGFIVVIFVAAAFITLAIFYWNAQKKLIQNGLEDGAIRAEVEKELSTLRKHCHTRTEAEHYLVKKKKQGVILRVVMWSGVGLLLVAVLLLLIFSRTTSGGGHVWLGKKTYLTIQTESMSTANKVNTYLFDEAGIAYGRDRIPRHALISLSRDQKLIDGLQPGDVAAFVMTDEDGREITVVHRLVGVEQDEEGRLRYTFRGDANPASMAGEYQITKDRIIGVYATPDWQGTQNLPMGYFVTYLRSATGIAMTTVAMLLMLVFLLLSDRMDAVYREKYAAMKREMLQGMFRGDEGESL